MKTIEQIKEEYKKETGHNLPIYTYNGKLGVIYNYGSDFISIEELLQLDPIDLDSIRSVTCESDICEEGEEITDAPIRNEENEQKLIVDCAWSSVAYHDSDEFVRELLVTTNQYYNWTSERKRMIDKIEDYYKQGEHSCYTLEGLRQEWEEIVRQYKDPCGFEEFSGTSSDFDSLVEEAYKEW